MTRPHNERWIAWECLIGRLGTSTSPAICEIGGEGGLLKVVAIFEGVGEVNMIVRKCQIGYTLADAMEGAFPTTTVTKC